ncbi:MAG TPA: response regulator, partial [Anaerolineae bacterium]|nr:response regulator [Anaerolineae bacterium]
MSSEKIIIVDDEIDVLDLCKRILEAKGYQVTTARDGHQVVEFAKKEHFDLLLTDIRMPGMSGLDVAQAVKQFAPNVICVTMTGFSTMDMAIEALKLGIDEFIMKPFSPDELSMTISKALDKERLRKENFRLRSLIPLFELNKTLLGTVEVEEVLRQLLDISRAETKADLAKIYTFEQGEIVAHFESEADNGASQQQEASNQLAQLIFQSSQQLILQLQNADPQHDALRDQLQAQFVIATPLKSKESNLGALILARSQSNFAAGDANFLSVLAGQASIALENAHLFTEIQKAYEELKMLDHMKSEFINIAAHELRTPLAIL